MRATFAHFEMAIGAQYNLTINIINDYDVGVPLSVNYKYVVVLCLAFDHEIYILIKIYQYVHTVTCYLPFMFFFMV